MTDKIYIETYKDVKIYYSIQSNRFHCKFNEGRLKRRKNWSRMSLLELRDAIDKHFQKNKKFEPFQCLKIRNGKIENVTVTSIRIDGAWQGRFEDGSSRKISSYERDYLYAKNQNNVKFQKEINKIQAKVYKKTNEITKLKKKIDSISQKMEHITIYDK